MGALRDFVKNYIDPSSSAPADDADGIGGGVCVDSNAVQPSPSLDPNAGQPDQPVDPDGGRPNPSGDPDASQPDQALAHLGSGVVWSVDANAGQLGLPGDAPAGITEEDAYKAGFQDGKRGAPPSCYEAPMEQAYERGYKDGKAAAAEPSPSDDQEPGPTIGPDTSDERGEGPELPEGFDEESPLTRQEYSHYRYFKITIATANRKIAFGLMRWKAWQDSGLSDGDLKEYERLFEIFGPSDPSPVPPPSLSLAQLEEEPDEEELGEGE